jgi:flagellar basal-body rod modification protein FlgD
MTTTTAVNGASTPTSAAGSASAASAASTTGVGSLNMSDFLTLMTTQLQNQDPMNPTDSSTFLAELSQMSTVEGITSMQSSLSTLSDSLLKSSAISSAGLVGKNVLAAASSSAYTAGNSLSGGVLVPDGATGVTVNVQDASGTTIKQITVPSGSGLENFTWDGTDSSGAQAASGTYTFSASANVGGGTKTATVYLPGTVGSVSIDASGTGVTLNTYQLGSVALSDVSQID